VFNVEDGGGRFLGHTGDCLYIWQIQGVTSRMEVRFEFQDT